MRKFILSAIVATVATVTFAAPSQAGGYSFGFGNGNGYVTVGGYDNDYGHGYGHKKHYKKHYQNDYYQQECFFKKVKRWDSYGNPVWKKIKVCH
ncbi:hypothetical protein [Pararhizobium sp.]|uniref:hypothetical protein n=1 Tax=Pararhizobium sp. TaxID=1977563 RepID=UPI00271AEB50|nr:hypothetical protein [Pararhizobium sp.]MDO9414955.1 hypothetical protein [Pararhizobium sp.]